MNFAIHNASRLSYHDTEWAINAGQKAYLIKFNGGSDDQVREHIEKEYPATPEVPYGEYKRIARKGYGEMRKRLSRWEGKGKVAALNMDGTAVIMPREKLPECKAVEFRWVQNLIGV